MSNFKKELTDAAHELGAVFKRDQFKVEKEILTLKLEMQQKEASASAAGLAFERSLKFAASSGADFVCPSCWVRQERRVTLHCVPSASSDDLFKCRECHSTYLSEG